MIVFLSIVSLVIAFKVYQKFTCGMCICDDKMMNKVVIVTGSNTGIGYETAKNLAERGAKVILACRDVQRGIAAKDKIITSTGNKNTIFKQLDLTSFKSIENFVDDILKTEPKLDILINNAGTGKLDNSLTENNLPIEAQVNHFGPYLLTISLLPLLKASAPSRIIMVSSLMHKFGKMDIENFDKQAKSTLLHRRVYSNTKLANLLFTRKLAKLLDGTGVTVNALHPGAVSTDMFRNQYSITRFLISLIFKTPLEGAQTSIYLAVAPEMEKISGKYFSDCKEKNPGKNAEDDQAAENLWTLSENIISSHKKQ